MIDFSINGQVSVVRRRPLLPLAVSVAIHAVAVTLVLALTFSDGIAAPRRPMGAMVLLAPLPVIHAVRPGFIAGARTAQPAHRISPRLFRAPAIRFPSVLLREPAAISGLQIPLLEAVRPLLPAAEVARWAVEPPPPFRVDNLDAFAARAPAPASSVTVVSRSSGFEQMAVETLPHPRTPPLSSGNFGDATMAPASQLHQAGTAPALPITRPVEILSKPRPSYSEEARRQRIEGEVLLEILFAASGQVHVLRIVRGLGDGLDEHAISAAEAIRFRPAERAGMAADSTAIVHIVFQLAF